MKKVRVIITVVAAALMIMGVGYALWTQVLNVTVIGTSGKLEVNFIDVQPTEGSPALVCTATTFGKTSANIRLKNIYPGSHQTYQFTVKNVGTIPAKFKGISVIAGQNTGKNDYTSLRFPDIGNKTVNVTDDSMSLFDVLLEPRDEYTFSVTCLFGGDIPNEYQGQSGSFTFHFNYIQ